MSTVHIGSPHGPVEVSVYPHPGGFHVSIYGRQIRSGAAREAIERMDVVDYASRDQDGCLRMMARYFTSIWETQDIIARLTETSRA